MVGLQGARLSGAARMSSASVGDGAAGFFEHRGEVRPVLCGGLEGCDPLAGGDQFGSRVIEAAFVDEGVCVGCCSILLRSGGIRVSWGRGRRGRFSLLDHAQQ